MGIESKKAPPLPAPTESDSHSDISTPTELGTNVSRPQDNKSSFSLPDDGTPVTIKTRGHKPNRSQTSLLIEYFEGGKSSPANNSSTSRKPSVRVRLTPSKGGRGKNDHIQITETKSTRKTSMSRRATASPAVSRSELDLDPEETRSMNSYASATEESNVSRNPIEVEITPSHSHRRRDRKVSSPLIPASDSKTSLYIPANVSDISAIPTDSFLDGSGNTTNLSQVTRRSKSPSRGEAAAAGALGAVAGVVAADRMNRKTRSESHDRKIIEKAVEKASKPDRKHRSKSRTSSVGEKEIEKSSVRRRSKAGHKESVVSAAESSVLSSQMAPSHRSYDSHSSSKVSINNPKLLETVEDAIRRLILPELDAIKRERSQRETRKVKDRDSLSSLTSASREDIAPTSKRKSGDTTHSTKSRDREARNDLSPQGSIEQISVIESVPGEDNTPRRDKDRSGHAALLGVATAAAAAGAALAERDRSRADEKRQRRRRRAKTPERGRAAEDYDGVEHAVIPPMPLQSEINPSEMTRTSILSADTDRPHSASEEMVPVHEVNRGSVESVQDTNTPTRTQATLQALGTQHMNISHGDLRNLPRQGPGEYEQYEDSDLSQRQRQDEYVDEYDDEYDDSGLAEPGMYDQEFFGHQDVPAPLRYVPYQQERRGLSPIESVSGYTESDIHHRRDSKLTQSELSSPEKPLNVTRDVHSPSSIPSNMRSRDFGDEESSVRSSGNYRNTTYTDDSELDRVTSGQAVRGLGANPQFVHPPFAAESAVASLIDGSVVEPSILSGGQDYRDSQISYDAREYVSGGSSPEKRSVDNRREVAGQRDQSPALSKQDASDVSRGFSEYDIDENGRKVPQYYQPSPAHQTPTASEQATINAAVRAAAAKTKAKQGVSLNAETGDEFVGEGVSRNKSFKERAKTDGYQPNTTPRHSMDRLSDDYDHPKMGVSGLPDASHPMPEIGYGYTEEQQTPSIVQGPLGGSQHGDQEHWPTETTPTQDKTFDYDGPVTPRASRNSHRGLGIGEATVVAVVASGSAMAVSHSRQPSQDQDDEWQRTSAERKRDTLVTNPYEGASPIANLPGLESNMLGGGGYGMDVYRGGYNTGSPGLGHGDEGYISAAPNETRDGQITKGKGVDFLEQANLGRKPDDPFYAPGGLQSTRHLSGMSQGLGSPLYDGATGNGIDRIQSKDIIALMEHLMVRDAQRSARDTEMLVTLVRSAAEMRNSFNDIKRLLADSEDQIIGEVKENTEKTVQKHIGGPRPLPGSAPRSIMAGSQAGTLDDLPAKKRNLFRRALKSLGAKGSNDLGRIEDMLNQLLTEVDDLKHQSTGNPIAGMMSTQNRTMDNIQPEVQYEQDRGYEPEGNAGTSTASHASQSGHLSIPQSRGTSMKQGYERKFSDHRISTVPEDNEEEYHSQPGVVAADPYSNPDLLMSPAIQPQRGDSVPLGTPPQLAGQGNSNSAPQSYENTPLTDGGKKHKRGSSSFFPKISRWSETTTSSIGKVFRNSGNSRKNDQADEFLQHPPSRSGSDLGQYEYPQHQDPYGEDKLHTGFSEQDLLNTATLQPQQQLPTPTRIELHDPPMTYATPEDPKYKAHRNSLNLQHPQPRPGQTERFRTALETSAQDYDTPMSPGSADWAGSATSLNRFPAQHTHRYSDQSGNPNTQEYSWSSPAPQQSQQGPPRPPKEPLDTPPRNERVNKLQKKQPGSPLSYNSGDDNINVIRNSPRPENRNLNAALGQPARRPSGPRAMTPSRAMRGESQSPVGSVGSQGHEENRAREERRRKRDTFGTVASQESETF